MKYLAPLAAVLGGLLVAGPAPAQNRFVATHGQTDANYQAWVNKVTKDGYRLQHVSAATAGTTTLFAAVAVDDGLAFAARHHLTADQYQQEFTRWTNQGYQLVSITGYPHNGATNYAAVWV